MLTRTAYLLDKANLKNLCFLYFLLSPFLLDRKSFTVLAVIFGVGYILSGTIALLALSERIVAFSERIRFKGTTILVLALLAFAVLSLIINGPTRLITPWLVYFKLGKLVFPMIVFFVMINIWTRRDIPKLYSLVVIMACVSFAALLIDFASWMATRHQPLPRVGILIFADPNKYAIFLNVLYGFLLPKLLARLKEGLPSRHLIAAISLICLALFMTLSRSGVFTFVVVTLLALWLSRSRRVISRVVILMAPVAILFLVAIVIRYAAKEGAVISDTGRLWTYMVAWNVIQARPFTGIGFANVVEAYNVYGTLSLSMIGQPLDIHNATLEIFSEQGIFGALAYLLFVFVPVVLLFKRASRISVRQYPVAEVAALNIPVVFFCYGLFYHGYLTNEFFWAYMAFTFIVLRSDPSSDTGMKLSSPRWL